MTPLLAGLAPAGALLGLVAGAGLWIIIIRLPRWRSPALDARLAPYIRGTRPSRLLPPSLPENAGPLRAFERLLSPVMADAVRWAERLSSGPATVRRRLDQLGGGMSVEQFRAEQVVWAVLGALTGTGSAALLSLATGHLAAFPVAVLAATGTLLGLLGRDYRLSGQVRRRERLMLAEFPTVAELVALSVSAGEGAVGALERVGRTCHGELAAELRRTLSDARAGAPLAHALEDLSRRTSLPSLARFADGVAIAIERGTPLGDVLRAQAQDVRELTRRHLIEAGGRKEILMMVPVVMQKVFF
jgi:tight adherence protein C